MRRLSLLLVTGLVSLLVGPLAADKVVLRDGRTLDTKKPPEIRGRQAVLVLADGKLVSIPASEIDAEKTAALAKKSAQAAAAPKPAPTPVQAPSLAQAARAAQTGKKATVVLTDQDVAGSDYEPEDGEEGPGEGKVVVGSISGKRSGTGYAVDGSVQNVGKTTVDGVAVTVEAIDADGKSIASAFGLLAKDSLGPGEKTTFAAQIDTDKAAETFRCAPRWLSRPVPAGEGEQPADAKPADETAPTPTAAPPPEPTVAPRPADYAAPPANAPVGAPSQPGGTYLPPPSSDQPKPPGGGA